ncbi:MAG: cellulase family glycosylhydrolase [Anaerolineae bacterium]
MTEESLSHAQAQPPSSALGPRGRLRLALIALAALLALLVVLAGLGITRRQALSTWLFEHTGEERAFSQVKGAWDLFTDLLRPRVRTEDLVPVAHAGVNPFGVNVFLEQEVDPDKRERVVRMAAEAGFHWLRQEFPWEDIEIHGKGDFEDRRHEPHRSAWDKYDQIVALAEKYGMELIVRLSNPPPWSRAQGDAAGTYAPPDDYGDFGDFVAAVVGRYRGRIRYYQIWNEPNIYPEWGEQPVNPREYTELLKVGYARAKAADPDVVIISGALASTIEVDYRNLNDFVFLQQMYDAGAGPYFDVLAMQGYGLWSGPTDRRMQPRVVNFSRPLYIRDLMVRNGDARKPIWISEMNWCAVPDEVPDKRFGQVSEAVQARYVTLAYQRAQEEWPWVGVVNFWYFKRPDDRWKAEGKPEYYFRMVEPDFTPLPVYDAVQAYTAQPPVVYRGWHQEDHWAVRYEGNWVDRDELLAVFGRVRQAEEVGSRLSFTFHGREVVLQVLRGPSEGQVRLTVDGEPQDLNLRSPAPDLTGLSVAQDLPPGDHAVELTVLAPPVAVDGFLVR